MSEIDFKDAGQRLMAAKLAIKEADSCIECSDKDHPPFNMTDSHTLKGLAESVIALQAENKGLVEEMDRHNMAASQALDELWKEIILKHKPDYGDWEYPMQAKRHIVCEFDDLQAENKELREVIATAIEKIDEPAVQANGEWQTGMFCGLEDRNITDRYDACMYGYEQAIGKVQEWVIGYLEDQQQALKEKE